MFGKQWILIAIATLLVFLTVSVSAKRVAADQHESCEYWASVGECEKNPNYMLQSCATSCAKQHEIASLKIPASFYDIAEKDIHGNTIKFDRFRGKVVYVVNVASQCGYTEENYEKIRELQTKYLHSGLEIVLAPCNGFGNQEPGSAADIYRFAVNQYDFNGILLSRDDVNGFNTRESFRYLKAKTGKDFIEWNFDGKFLVDRQGNAFAVTMAELDDKIDELIAQPASSEF